MAIPFRGMPLTFRCLDCTKGVGDRNGGRVVGQIEAHLVQHPDHRLVVSSERTGHHLNDITSDIRKLIRAGVIPFPNERGRGYGGEVIEHEDHPPMSPDLDAATILEIPDDSGDP